MTLPDGSKQDKRGLYVSAAKMVLELVSKKNGATIKNTEVLSLAPAAVNNFTIESLKTNLKQNGWTITPVAGEPQYLWIEQNGKTVLAYIANEKKETNLYFGETSSPLISSGSPNNNTPPITTCPQEQPTQQDQVIQQQPIHSPAPSVQNGYQYMSSNFDDGWISIETTDWVEVSKPGIKILIHYPNQKVDEYTSVKLDGDYRAWNTLVAPRYTNISNFLERGIQDYQSITFLTADAMDASGKKVHVVLFKKKYDTGVGRYLEIVADDKQTFEREFGNNYINRSDWSYMDQIKSWDRLANMQWRNKFAIGASDLNGKWSSSSYASLSYYYVNGGGFAGATATSIADEFVFTGNGTYQSDHAGASGVVGNQNFSRQQYKGNVTVTDWTITLTNRLQNQTETYNSYFEAVRGGRLLIMTDRLGTTLTLVKAKQ
ncbi:MAG TPA: hypothetical protein VFV46_13345 [Lacibacter sp.]|nr:hypothetical protein [Lacibacter sp.]